MFRSSDLRAARASVEDVGLTQGDAVIDPIARPHQRGCVGPAVIALACFEARAMRHVPGTPFSPSTSRLKACGDPYSTDSAVRAGQAADRLPTGARYGGFYRFENWKLRRALALPYFLRSTTRLSRVRKPPCFSTGRSPGS